ncbi:MAG TPA: DNA repair and recombination protein RadA [Candidatus Lokiarchaeia archaeon]|nr:DNA repair and recombination protein RadA [Candidatus Lokiarchaeia archaeon]
MPLLLITINFRLFKAELGEKSNTYHNRGATKTVLNDISELPGIKPRQVKLLQDQGIMTAQALAMLAPDALSEIDGISGKSAKQLIWQARESLNLTAFVPAGQIKDDYQHITTLSGELDRILGGGVSTGRITEVFGAFKSGKTCLSHSVAVSVQLPPERGGLGKACAFVDTENTFSKEKAERIARRVGIDPAEALSHIFHVKVFSSDHQMQMVRNSESIIESHNIGLIIVDSLMALFRAEYVGIGALARRQQALNNLIHDLGRIAEVYNVAILVTNQVATRMLGAGFAQDDAIGGNIVAHGCHFRLQFQAKGFQKNQSLERKAIIVDAPDLPPEDCQFFITEAGVADTEQVEYALRDGKTTESPKKKKKAKVTAPVEDEVLEKA